MFHLVDVMFVMAALVAAIHAFLRSNQQSKAWMPGIKPGITENSDAPLTSAARCGSSAFMRRLFSYFLVCFASPAFAMVGNAPPADPAISRHLVLIVSSRGSSCTGVVVARDLILTAGHCASPDAQYKFVTFDSAGNAKLNDIASIQRHPQFDLNAFNNHRATADVALMKTALPLPANFVAGAHRRAAKARGRSAISRRGYGLAVPGDGRSGGKARQATLTVTGQPGSLQIRLVDPSTNNAAPGLGGCTGDSGAPAFDMSGGAPVVIGW